MIKTNIDSLESYTPTSPFEIRVKKCLLEIKSQLNNINTIQNNKISLSPKDIYLYTNHSSTIKDVVEWLNTLSPSSGDIIIINTTDSIRGTYIICDSPVKDECDLAKILTPLETISSVIINNKDYLPEDGILNLGITKFKCNNPELLSSNGKCTWIISHNLDEESPEVTVLDNVSKLYLNVDIMIVDKNRIKVIIDSPTNIPKGYYTITIRK